MNALKVIILRWFEATYLIKFRFQANIRAIRSRSHQAKYLTMLTWHLVEKTLEGLPSAQRANARRWWELILRIIFSSVSIEPNLNVGQLDRPAIPAEVRTLLKERVSNDVADFIFSDEYFRGLFSLGFIHGGCHLERVADLLMDWALLKVTSESFKWLLSSNVINS